MRVLAIVSHLRAHMKRAIGAAAAVMVIALAYQRGGGGEGGGSNYKNNMKALVATPTTVSGLRKRDSRDRLSMCSEEEEERDAENSQSRPVWLSPSIPPSLRCSMVESARLGTLEGVVFELAALAMNEDLPSDPVVDTQHCAVKSISTEILISMWYSCGKLMTPYLAMSFLSTANHPPTIRPDQNSTSPSFLSPNPPPPPFSLKVSASATRLLLSLLARGVCHSIPVSCIHFTAEELRHFF